VWGSADGCKRKFDVKKYAATWLASGASAASGSKGGSGSSKDLGSTSKEGGGSTSKTGNGSTDQSATKPVSTMLVAELRAELAACGEDAKGKKAELASRLEAVRAASNDGGDSSGAGGGSSSKEGSAAKKARKK
jgi:hypothetical protein